MPALQLDQVVRNLVLNARDAMPAGGTITVSTRAAGECVYPGGPEKVLLEIRDTGTGMDEATLARIFEPFFTTKSEQEGTGLGLSMVQMIVEAVGGRIQVESSGGAGSLFRITLPSAAARNPAKVEDPARVRPGSA
jgi:two-component system, cell cycle sensor histidine kinase and response regulator CckA